MAQGHDHAVVRGARRHFEAVGPPVFAHRERVIPAREERSAQARRTRRGHRARSIDVLPCTGRGARTTDAPNTCADGLVPQAHAEDGHARREHADDLRSRCRRLRAGPARAKSGCGQAPAPRSRRALIASLRYTHRRRAQLAEVLDEVVGERVEVVDDEHHAAILPAPTGRAPRVRGRAAAPAPCPASPRTPPPDRSRPRCRRRPARARAGPR